MTNQEMFEKSFERPKNFFKLPAETQWEIDKQLGILDWLGDDMTQEEMKGLKTIMKDNRGTEIEIGHTVCYNYQGEVALGEVEKIIQGKFNKWRNEYEYTYHVKRLFPEIENKLFTKLSKVTSSKNLMVIFEDK